MAETTAVSKYLYFLARNSEKESPMEWYTFMLNTKDDNNNSKFVPRLNPIMATDFSPPSTFVSLGSIIFCVSAGCNRSDFPSSKFYGFDTADPEKGWTRCPDMNLARWSPQAVAMDGKLYVMAGTDCYQSPQPAWFEVFDPVLNSWEILTIPLENLERNMEFESYFDDTEDYYLTNSSMMPHDCSIIATAIQNDSYEEILVASTISTNGLFYNAIKKSWKIRRGYDFTRVVGKRNPVVVGRTLYWYNIGSQELEAYDLKQRVWLSGPIEGLEEVCGGHNKVSNFTMLSLGGMDVVNGCRVHGLGLVWFDSGWFNVPYYRLLHCTKVQVMTMLSSPSVFVQSSNSFMVPTKIRIVSGLML